MNLIPIEHREQRVLTTQQLAEFYGTDDKKIRDNFTNNRDRYIPGKHYYKVEGEELQRLKNDTENFGAVGDRASSVYLWTEKGAWLQAKSLNTDKAWEAYEMLVDTYYEIKQNSLDVSKLTPELRMFKQIFDSVAAQQMQVQQLQGEIAVAKEQVQEIREVVTITPGADWRAKTNKLLQKIGYKLGDYEKPKQEVYTAVEKRGGYSLERRLDNLMTRALKNGMAPSKVKQLNYLDVIAEDKKLIEIYTAIVKEIAIKHGVAA